MENQQMKRPEIRDVIEADFEVVLRLNLESERFLSPLTQERLKYLYENCVYFRVVSINGEVIAFMIAFREGAGYDSPNYQYFSRRHDSFLYVDRIVIDSRYQGKQIGGMLYKDIFQFAKVSGVNRITCEIDIEPPNEISRKFHERLGFKEIDTQIAHCGKRVSLQEKKL